MNRVLSWLLQELGVPHTKSYLQKICLEHPNRDTLLGMSKVLRRFGVHTMAMRVADKENLWKLPLPLLAETVHGMVLVREAADDHVAYLWHGAEYQTSGEVFVNKWNGVCLLAEADAGSCEPDIDKHQAEERVMAGENMAAGVGLLLLLTAWVWAGGALSAFSWITLLLHLAATGLCYLLVKKSLHRESRFADKLCSAFGSTGCGTMTDSAKLIGRYGWSECGMAFFVGNLLALSVFPELKAALPLVFACALPYTLWSVWYQAVRAKEWCPMCLMVQALVWIQFSVCLFLVGFSYESLTETFVNFHVLMFPISYVLLLLALHKHIRRCEDAGDVYELRYKLNCIKSDPQRFTRALSETPVYELPDNLPLLRFGKSDGGGKPVVTVVSNLYCKPCARMHQRLLALSDSGFAIQYVPASFTEELWEVNRMFVALYHKYGPEPTWKKLTCWYAGGKEKGTAFFEDVLTSEEIVECNAAGITQRLDAWVARAGIYSTPTVLVGNHLLPEHYEIEDLVEIYN